jgi:hypothetical protein
MQPAFSSSSLSPCCACALRRLGLPPLRGVVEPFFPDRVGDLSRVFFGEVEPRVLRLGVVVDALGEGAGIRLSRLEGGEGTGDMMVAWRGVATSVTYPLSLSRCLPRACGWRSTRDPPGGMERKTLFRLAWMSAVSINDLTQQHSKDELERSRSVEIRRDERRKSRRAKRILACLGDQFKTELSDGQLSARRSFPYVNWPLLRNEGTCLALAAQIRRYSKSRL